MVNKLLRHLATIGNVVFILWMLYNGIDEGFKAPRAQIISILTLIILLILNIGLINSNPKNN